MLTRCDSIGTAGALAYNDVQREDDNVDGELIALLSVLGVAIGVAIAGFAVSNGHLIGSAMAIFFITCVSIGRRLDHLYEPEKKNRKSNVRPRQKPPARETAVLGHRKAIKKPPSTKSKGSKMKLSGSQRNLAKFYSWWRVVTILDWIQFFGGLLVMLMTTHGNNDPAWFWPWFWISFGSLALLLVPGAIAGHKLGKRRYDW